MKLSVPVHQLKRRARKLSRETGIPLSKALDHIARQEGFNSWSLLAAKASATTNASDLLAQLSQGDLVLLGARPGHGKTLMGLKLIVEAMKLGHRGMFFTLEYTEADVISRFKAAGGDMSAFGDLFEFDNSDAINSDYIIGRLAAAQRGTVIVVDYLQLLDQKRSNPDLMVQIRALKTFSSRHINKNRNTSGTPVWQRNYFDRVIRNETELYKIREYIRNNPLQWELDENNPENL